MLGNVLSKKNFAIVNVIDVHDIEKFIELVESELLYLYWNLD